MAQMNKKSDVVPWSNKKEFEAVFHDLYHTDLTRKRRGVDQISVWQTRQHPSLPTGIDTTDTIIRSIIHDVLLKHNATLCQPADICMMYSVALIRFVNLISELERPGVRKLPIRYIAKKHGIPSWLVALRHDATHATYPSLSVLRNGADAALTWLYNNYWVPELASFSDMVHLPNCMEAKIVEVISQFQEKQFDLLYLTPVTAKGKKPRIGAILCSIESLVKSHREKFIDILVTPGFLIPTVANLESLLSISERSFFDETDMELPLSIEKFWYPIIKIIKKKGLIQDLIQVLLLYQKENIQLYQKIVICWALKLLRAAVFVGQPPEKQTPISRLFLGPKIQFRWLQLLNSAYKYPSKYSPTLMPIITAHLHIPKEQISHLMFLVAIQLGQAISTKTTDSQSNDVKDHERFFTVEQLRAKREIEKCVVAGQDPTATNKTWELATDIDWRTIPLGAVFGEEDSDIEMAEEVIAIEEQSNTCAEEEEYVERFIINDEDNIEIEDCTDNIVYPQKDLTIRKPGNFLYFFKSSFS